MNFIELKILNEIYKPRRLKYFSLYDTTKFTGTYIMCAHINCNMTGPRGFSHIFFRVNRNNF